MDLSGWRPFGGESYEIGRDPHLNRRLPAMKAWLSSRAVLAMFGLEASNEFC